MSYSFKGKSTKGVRLAVNKNAIFEQKGNMTGYNILPQVAQDELEDQNEAQTDTRLITRPYEDKDGNTKYDNKLGVSKGQMEDIAAVGEHEGSDYYTFKADVGFSKDKDGKNRTFINTKTLESVDKPFDKEAHEQARDYAKAAKEEARAKEAKAKAAQTDKAAEASEPELEA